MALLLPLLVAMATVLRGVSGGLDGRLFVLSFMHIGRDNDDPGLEEVIVNALTDTKIRIELPEPFPTQHYTLDQTNNYELNFTYTADFSVSLSQVSARVGVMVSSDKPISISATKSHAGTTGAYLAMPITGNATEFFVPAWPGQSTITISSVARDACAEIYKVNGSVYERYEFLHLQRLHVHHFTLDGVGEDFTGYYINSTRPLSLLAGSIIANIPKIDVQYGDHIVEQVPPMIEWGKRFMMVNPVGRNKAAGYDFRVVAGYPGTTEITIVHPPSAPEMFSITRGNFISQSTGFGISTDSITLIECSQPCLVAQYNRGYETVPGGEPDETDPSMLIIPSVDHWPDCVKFGTNRYYRHQVGAAVEGINYLLIFAKSTATSGITINGQTTTAWTPMPTGNWASGYSWHSRRITQGHFTILSSNPNERFMVVAQGHGSVADEHTSWAYLGGYRVTDNEWAGDWYNITYYDPNNNGVVTQAPVPVLPGLGLDIDFTQPQPEKDDMPYYEVQWIATFYTKERAGKIISRQCSEGYGRYVFDQEVSVLVNELNKPGGLIDVNCEVDGIVGSSSGLGYYTEYTRGQVTLKLALQGTVDHTLFQVKRCGGRIKTALKNYRGWGGTFQLGDESLIVPDQDFQTNECDPVFFLPDHFVEYKEAWLCNAIVTEVHFSSGSDKLRMGSTTALLITIVSSGWFILYNRW